MNSSVEGYKNRLKPGFVKIQAFLCIYWITQIPKTGVFQ